MSLSIWEFQRPLYTFASSNINARTRHEIDENISYLRLCWLQTNDGNGMKCPGARIGIVCIINNLMLHRILPYALWSGSEKWAEWVYDMIEVIASGVCVCAVCLTVVSSYCHVNGFICRPMDGILRYELLWVHPCDGNNTQDTGVIYQIHCRDLRLS